MPSRVTLTPCVHRATNQIYVNLGGRRIYCGKVGTPAADARYKELLSEWLSQQSGKSVASRKIGELALMRLKWAQSYYLKNGCPTSQIHLVRRAMQELVRQHSEMLCAEFGPRALQAIQHRLNSPDHSRVYVNKLISEIKSAFSWGVSQEVVSTTVADALRHVPGLHKGRSRATECPPVRPANDDTVESVLSHCSPQIAAMVRLQRLTGMRPGEVIKIRPADIVTTDSPWIYTPQSHKTEAHDLTRSIHFGPQAQIILTPWLNRSTDTCCFSPAEVPGTRSRTTQYTEAAYRRAITRACNRAGVERFSPNQLRHSHATDVRRQFGLEAAQVSLGHSKADVTQIYAERNQDLARQVASKIG